MTNFIITMYVSKPEEIQTRASVRDIKLNIAKEFNGYTLIPNCEGVWFSSEGELFRDNVDKIEIMVYEYDIFVRAKIEKFIRQLGKAYGQQALPFTVVSSENHMVQIEIDD